jgi:hypothetical protein
VVVPECTSAEFGEEGPVVEGPVLEDRVDTGLHVTWSRIEVTCAFQDLCRHHVSHRVTIRDEMKDECDESRRSVHPVLKLCRECDLQNKHRHLKVTPVDYDRGYEPCTVLPLFDNAYEN